jgi:lipopolysaccharide biosynthesis glycosyltransferase
MKILFLTCTNNYLPRAVRLVEAFLQHNPGYQVFTGLTDRLPTQPALAQMAAQVNAMPIENLKIPDFEQLWRHYTVYELSNAVKPLFADYILQHYPQVDTIIYLDTDTHVYDSFQAVEEQLKQHPIVLAAYTYAPMAQVTPIQHVMEGFKIEGYFEERMMLYSGIYNGGFWAINRSETSQKFIDWWKIRAANQGFGGHKRGLFVEQKWLNLVPLFFPETHVLRHLGYNVAPWNLHERKISTENDKYLVNKKFPLIFYHFSGFNFGQPNLISGWGTLTLEQRPDVAPLYQAYYQILLTSGFKEYQHVPCYFIQLQQAEKLARLGQQAASLPPYRRWLGKLLGTSWELTPRPLKNAIKKVLRFSQSKVDEFEGSE